MVKYREYNIVSGMNVIKLTPQDIIDFNLVKGDMIDIEDAVGSRSLSEQDYQLFLKKRGKKK